MKLNNEELRKAAEATEGLEESSRYHVQIDYNRETGEIYTNEQVGQSETRWTDDNIIHVTDARWPLSIEEIKDMIEYAMEEIDRKSAYLRSEVQAAEEFTFSPDNLTAVQNNLPPKVLPADLFEATQTVAQLEGISVIVDDTPAAEAEQREPITNSIIINHHTEQYAAAGELLHEYAYALVHNTASPATSVPAQQFEAEYLSALLMQHYGIQIPEEHHSLLAENMEAAVAANPDWNLNKSIAKAEKAFGHTKERIDQLLVVAQEKQLERAQMQQMAQNKQPLEPLPLQENFLKGL